MFHTNMSDSFADPHNIRVSYTILLNKYQIPLVLPPLVFSTDHCFDGDTWLFNRLFMIKYLKRTWQIRTGRYETPFDGGVPFWMLSLILHLVVILVIAKMLMPSADDDDLNLVSGIDQSEVIELADLEEVVPEVMFEDSEAVEIGDTELDFEEIELATPVLSLENETPDNFDSIISDDGMLAIGAEDGGAGSEAFAEIATKGVAGRSVSQAAGAVDRISAEIMRSLENNKTLVVWLFDQSISLLEQRSNIEKRLDIVYRDLRDAGVLGDETVNQIQQFRLQTDVIAFGQSINPMLKRPATNFDQVRDAIGKIQRDDSGTENVMAAVMMAANRYKGLHKLDSETGKRKRDVLLIVVSDEAGDDGRLTDQAVGVCRANQIPVSVIGVPSPFGRKQTEVKWVDPDPEYDQTPQVALVNQGPESMMPERLRLDFSGNFDDLEMIASGFGPFDLTKLCYLTGGTYFAVHPNSNKRSVNWNEVSNYSAYLRHFFDGDAMKPYRPDYVTRAEYQRMLSSSAMRNALVKSAAFSSTGALSRPRLRFPKFEEAQFVNLVTRAQRSAAIVEPKLNQLYDILKAGEKDRPTEISPRWQAGYDLAMGRALAAKIRAETYNMMLALAKTKLKFDPSGDQKRPNNTWLLRPANTVETGSRGEKLAEKARAYLERVVADHPDTPWAMIAERELATPIGWSWKQTYTPPPGQRRRMPNGNNNNPKPPTNTEPPKKRPPPRL